MKTTSAFDSDLRNAFVYLQSAVAETDDVGLKNVLNDMVIEVKAIRDAIADREEANVVGF